MKFEPRKLILKDGREALLRPAVIEDAADMIDFLKSTAADTPFLMRYPDEVTFTEEREQAFLAQAQTHERAVMMNACIDGILAGNCSFSPVGPMRRGRHRCSMGIAIRKEYWGLGLGTAMLVYLAELAQQAEFAQMELEVMDGNTAAIALYQKCGFTQTGRIPNGIRYDDGTCRDVLVMVRSL